MPWPQLLSADNKAVCALLLHPQGADEASEAPPASSTVGDADEADSLRSTPLLSKTAGIRDAGFVFAPAKSWWAGLLLVVVSGLVLGVTLFTTLMV